MTTNVNFRFTFTFIDFLPFCKVCQIAVKIFVYAFCFVRQLFHFQSTNFLQNERYTCSPSEASSRGHSAFSV